MAGESPDKSEQRKSSGEATQEQDPRLAVFRESAVVRDADADATAGEADQRGADTGRDAAPRPDGSADGRALDTSEAAVDRRTAVFTVPRELGDSGARGATGAPVAASEGSSRGGTGAKREAEAVRATADEASDAGNPPKSAPELESTPQSQSESTAAEGASEAVGGRDVESGSAPRKPENAPDARPGAKSESAPAKGGRTAEPEPKAEVSPAKPENQGDAASESAAGGAGAAPGVAPAKAEARPSAGRNAEPESEAEVAPGGRESRDAAASAAPKAGRDAKSASGAASESAKPEDRGEAASESAADEAGAAPGKARGTSGAAQGRSEDERDTKAEAASAGPGSRDAAAATATSGAPKAGPDAKSKSKSGAVAPSAKATPTAAPGADEPGVDRKTAVFRALKRPEVDQPTTMLKLPQQPPAATPPSTGPELPAERTSKFVPLRSDDVRAPARPAGPPAAQAPAPGTGVAEAERTRQQPMPPLPPLDLLAELTNKPAPPETPARTAVRRVKIWTPLLVLVLIIFAVVQAVRPLPTPSLSLTAKPTYTFEGEKPALPWPGEGQGFMAATGLGTVDSFGEQKAVPIGSVAKAMTAYVVLKDKPLKKGEKGPSITVDAKAEADGGLDAQGESTLNTVREGDELTLHDALAALMIPSANNIARLLARWDSNGSEEAFVKKMNDTAKELGMNNTVYTDPSGLDATTVSSAEDQVKLGQKLVEIEALMDITRLPEWIDPSGKKWRNFNNLVPFDGALGIKTGSTTKAGGNLLFAAHKMVGDTDQLIVGAVLGQHKSPIIDTVNAVSKEVMLATQDELEGATIVKKGQVVGEVDNGLGTTVPVVATEDVKAVGWSGLTVKLELTEGKSVPHSAAAGTHVGTLTVGEGKSRVEVAVAVQGDLSEASFTDKLTRIG